MKHFTYEELIYSATALKYGIRNRTTKLVEQNLKALVDNVLDPLRDYMGKAINVTSGYRCEALNKKVGGAAKSSHLYGMAADITIGTKSGNKTLAKVIVAKYPFDQVIDESDYQWVHVSYNPNGTNRRQILRIKNGKTEIITADKL